MQMSHNIINELKIEARFISQDGQPMYLGWSQRGDLLAYSISNDHRSHEVIVWNIFKRQKKCHFETGHTDTIRSVKFMPASNDTQVVTSGDDNNVRLTNLLINRNSCVYEDDNKKSGTIVQLAAHPNEPNLIWSVGFNHIMQYDIRESHGSYNPCFPVEIKSHFNPYFGNCIAINPSRSEMLAIGSGVSCIYLFDRRALKLDARQSCIANFAPRNLNRRYYQSLCTDHLAFNHDGSELLASYQGDQVYLFNTYEPWEKFRWLDLLKYKSNPSIFDQMKNDLVKRETRINKKDYDFDRRYCRRVISRDGPGAANFFGVNDEFIVTSYGDGTLCIWDKNTTEIVKTIQANSIGALPQPNTCLLATIYRDIDACTNKAVELWSTIGRTNIAPIS